MLKIKYSETGPTLKATEARLRRASGLAVRGLAFDVRDALRDGMRTSFDRPKPFTLNAFRVDVVKGDNPEALVWALPKQAQYLFWEIEGGTRKSKAFEHKMALFGGRVAVPAVGTKLDGFGNVTLGLIRRMLADKNSSGKQGRFFIGTPKGRPGQEGVWARTNGNRKLTRVMDFADQAQYKARFDMSGIALQTVNAKWESQLLRAMRKT